MTFTASLAAAWARNDSLLCVGLDPEPAKFPAVLPALTVASMSPPWAPTPGTKNGISPTRRRTSASSAGKVAPTTSAHWPPAFHFVATSSATCWYNLRPPVSRNCRSEPPGLEVRQRMMTPRSFQAK